MIESKQKNLQRKANFFEETLWYGEENFKSFSSLE